MQLIQTFLLGIIALFIQGETIMRQHGDLRREMTSVKCGAAQGSFRIDAIYKGATGTFNIATTPLGQDEDAVEVYHLTQLQNALSKGIRVNGCFEKNMLYRFVVYIEQPDTVGEAPAIGEYNLTVNKRQIATGETQLITKTFTEYYFMGDSSFCGGEYFALTIHFDSFPSEIQWRLLTQADEKEVTYESSLKKNSTSYTSEFNEKLLFVDHCLVADLWYRFEISDTFGDGLRKPNYYEVRLNGAVIAGAVGNFGFSDSTSFFSSPTNPPTAAPSVSASSYPTNPAGCAPITTSPSASFQFPTTGSTPSSFTNRPTKAQSQTPVSFPKEPQRFTGICFSGSNTVQIKGRGRTLMKFLQIGDEIAVGDGVYETVHGFGHYEPFGKSEMLQISTRTTSVLITHKHLIFVWRNGEQNPVPAASIRVGDSIVSCGCGSACAEIVESIKSMVVRDGLYAPFTPSGKLLVNEGLLVSSYVGFDDKKAGWTIGGLEFSYHWLAHSFEFPHRVTCFYIGDCRGETYTEDGLSLWVERPLHAAVWLLNLQSCVMKDFLFALFLLVMLMLNVCELLFENSVLFIAGTVLVWNVCRWPKQAD